MKNKPIFSGTNEAYVKLLASYADVSSNWTTSPYDALTHSERSAKRYGSRMAVLCYLPGLDKHFRRIDTRIGGRVDGDNLDIEWYFMNTPFADRREKEEKVRIYTQNQLRAFVEEHFTGDQKDSLRIMKYYETIFGVTAPGLQLRLA